MKKINKLLLIIKNKTTRLVVSYWTIFLTILLGFFFFGILQYFFVVGYVKSSKVIETTEITSLLSSIMAGIIIAFLASKVIQIRQEKISLKPKLCELTRSLHYFRKIVHEVFNNYDFWPKGLPSYIKSNYPDLTYYDVRDIIYIDKEISEEARKFIQDEEFGEIKKQAYLEMKSFLLPTRIFDQTVYSEFDVDLLYSSKILDKWQEYDCGNMIWYLFEEKFDLYEGQFDFNSFHITKQKDIELLSRKIDNERYKDMKFGPSLLGKLGAQIDIDIIPKLNKLQHSFEQGLPGILKFMYFVLSSMLIFGVILPIIIKLFNLPTITSFVSISVILSLTVYFILRLPYIMKREINIE